MDRLNSVLLLWRILRAMSNKKCWKMVWNFNNANSSFNAFVGHFCINVIQQRRFTVFNKPSWNIYKHFTSNKI